MPMVVPALEEDFYGHVRAAGSLTLHLSIVEVKGREAPQFTLTAPSQTGTGRPVMLYSRTKPEPKVFHSLRTLQSTLAKFGFHVAEIPIEPGSWDCFLPGVSKERAGCAANTNRTGTNRKR